MTFLYSRITLKSRYLETNFEKLEKKLAKFYVFRVFLEIIKNGVSHVLALTPSIVFIMIVFNFVSDYRTSLTPVGNITFVSIVEYS